MHSRKAWLVVAGCLGIGVLAFFAAQVGGEGPEARQVAQNEAVAAHAPDVRAVEALEVPGVPGEEPASVGVDPVEQAEPSPESESTPDALDRARLQAALEASIHGHIDPNVFLEAALALTELEVGDEALEELPLPATRYPLLGTPEGISAERGSLT